MTRFVAPGHAAAAQDPLVAAVGAAHALFRAVLLAAASLEVGGEVRAGGGFVLRVQQAAQLFQVAYGKVLGVAEHRTVASRVEEHVAGDIPVPYRVAGCFQSEAPALVDQPLQALFPLAAVLVLLEGLVMPEDEEQGAQVEAGGGDVDAGEAGGDPWDEVCCDDGENDETEPDQADAQSLEEKRRSREQEEQGQPVGLVGCQQVDGKEQDEGEHERDRSGGLRPFPDGA
jgi:hypothetical protein